MRANRLQSLTFVGQRRLDRRICAEGMRAAGFAEAAQQDRILRFEKKNLGRKHMLNTL